MDVLLSHVSFGFLFFYPSSSLALYPPSKDASSHKLSLGFLARLKLSNEYHKGYVPLEMAGRVSGEKRPLGLFKQLGIWPVPFYGFGNCCSKKNQTKTTTTTKKTSSKIFHLVNSAVVVY